MLAFFAYCFVTFCPLSLFAVDAENASKPPAETATDAAGLRVLPGFEVELLYSVPLESQGSWVSMTTDPQGRLIVCDQYGHLYRVTPSPIGKGKPGVEQVEKIEVDLGEAQGLLYAFDSLYVIVNQTRGHKSGLYRVRDVDGNDQFDSVEMLHEFEGTSEHGPHAIVLAPDAKSFYVIAGNKTELPTDIETYHVPQDLARGSFVAKEPLP